VIDKEMEKCVTHQYESESGENSFAVLPMVIFLLHISADQLQLRPCYQTIPLNGWSAIYVDAFDDVPLQSDGKSIRQEEEGLLTSHYSPQWMRVAFSLDTAPSLFDVHKEFSHLATAALSQAVQALGFQQNQRVSVKQIRDNSNQKRLEALGIHSSLNAYLNGDKDYIITMLERRPYISDTLIDSFAVLWGHLLQATVQENCERLARGATSRGLVASVRTSHKWLLSDFMRSVVKRDLAAGWALEALFRLPEGLL
jgi:hypothetical protein